MNRFIKIYYIFLILFTAGCITGQKDTGSKVSVYNYGNTSEASTKSADLIDNNTTYQVFFTIENKAECITIDIESVYLQKSFPIQKIPKKTYFIVEKELKLAYQSTRNNLKYVPLGRNFNNDWETFTPVKICTIKNDPLSTLDNSRYRIRFTTFEKLPVYYIITINSDQKIIFPEEKAFNPAK